MIWLAELPSAPTWKFMLVTEPSSRFCPLKFTDEPRREISAVIAVACVVIAVRAEVLFESLAAWTARSRRFPSRDCTCDSAPSAVCTTEVPSWALRLACVRPDTWAPRSVAMVRPAASSPALLMRRPLESFASDEDSEFCTFEVLVRVVRIEVGVDAESHLSSSVSRDLKCGPSVVRREWLSAEVLWPLAVRPEVGAAQTKVVRRFVQSGTRARRAWPAAQSKSQRAGRGRPRGAPERASAGPRAAAPPRSSTGSPVRGA